jgi:hypothetical protein
MLGFLIGTAGKRVLGNELNVHFDGRPVRDLCPSLLSARPATSSAATDRTLAANDLPVGRHADSTGRLQARRERSGRSGQSVAARDR